MRLLKSHLSFRFGDISIAAGDPAFKNYTQACHVDTADEIKVSCPLQCSACAGCLVQRMCSGLNFAQGNISNPGLGYADIAYSRLLLPPPVAPILGSANPQYGICNAYLPNDTVLNRYVSGLQAICPKSRCDCFLQRLKPPYLQVPLHCAVFCGKWLLCGPGKERDS